MGKVPSLLLFLLIYSLLSFFFFGLDLIFTQGEDINQGLEIGNNILCIDESLDTETLARGPSCFDLVTRQNRSSLNASWPCKLRSSRKFLGGGIF